MTKEELAYLAGFFKITQVTIKLLLCDGLEGDE